MNKETWDEFLKEANKSLLQDLLDTFETQLEYIISKEMYEIKNKNEEK